MELVKIILILIYINSNTANETENTEDSNPDKTQDQKEPFCIMETPITPSANSEKCYQINAFCKSGDSNTDIKGPCERQLQDACNNRVITIVCEPEQNLCADCLHSTISNCLTNGSSDAITVSLTCSVNHKWTVQQVIPSSSNPENESPSTISQSASEKSNENTTYITQPPGSEKSDLNTGNKTNIGIAVGTSLGTICIICTLVTVLIIRRKRSNQKKDINEFDKNHENGNDYIGDQGIALPEIETSAEYCELDTRYSSQKYTDVKHVPIKTPDTTYDYIDDFDRKHLSSSSDGITKISTFDLDKHLNVIENDTDYTVLEPEEVCTDLMATAEPSISRVDYAVLDPNETGFNRSEKSITPTNEPYAVLDPSVTGYDRSHAGNEYELAKSITTENENNSSGQLTEDNSEYISTVGQNENDYNTTNQQSKCQTTENVYNHSVDSVYDTANQNRKLEIPDNAYDHFVGQKTVDDYDMPKS